jgi:hypothetical protein
VTASFNRGASQLSLLDLAVEPAPASERRPAAPEPEVAIDPEVREHALKHLRDHAVAWGLEYVETGLLHTEVECSLARSTDNLDATLARLAADGFAERGASYDGSGGWRLAGTERDDAWLTLKPQVLAALADKARSWEPGAFVRTGLLECEVEHLAARDVSTDALDGVLAALAAEGIAESGAAYHGDKGWRLTDAHAAKARLDERAFSIEAPRAPAPTRRGRGAKPKAIEAQGPKARRLTDEERELLAGFEVDEHNVARCKLVGHRANFKLVTDIFRKVLGTGKWVGKVGSGGYPFPDGVDGWEKLTTAQRTGEVIDARDHGYFPTPAALADALAAFIDPQPGDVVLEPSAGRGALALAIRRRCPEARVLCVEMLPDNRKALAADGFEIVGEDFLAMPVERVDAVAMNPPFAQRADVHHITRALQWLKPGGRLAAIASAGVAYRDDALGVRFREELEAHGALCETNPPGSFLESGTGVETVSIYLTKRGQ